MVLLVKDPALLDVLIAVALVTSVALIQSLPLDLSQVAGTAKKKKKKFMCLCGGQSSEFEIQLICAVV